MRSFHFRDPRKTPSLKAVLWCCFRAPGDNRPGLTGLEIADWVRNQPGLRTANIRPASDLSEIRHWAETFMDANGNRVYYVPAAQRDRITENGAAVSRFVIWRYSDPRAEEAREKEMMKERKAA